MAAPAAPVDSEAAAAKPEHIQLAHQLADAAAAVSTRYFRTRVSVDVKADASPVTIADREAETAMRQLIMQQFPEHSIFGEEHGFQAGSSGSGSGYLWVIDPIDGTKSFITGELGAKASAVARSLPATCLLCAVGAAACWALPCRH